MQIESFSITGLLGRGDPVTGSLKQDINILTGRNGAGKTSVLKLLWYVISGNISLALKEVDFSSISITTNEYECTVKKYNRVTCQVDLTIGDVHHSFEDIRDDDGDVILDAEMQANPLLTERGSSVFFPTFRRIEGGFTLDTTRSTRTVARAPRTRSDVEQALISLAQRLTNEPHVFVTAISTVDIVGILLRKYTDLSEQSNRIQQEASQAIIETIKTFNDDAADITQIDEASRILDSIRSQIEEVEFARETIMTPLDAVRTLVETLFTRSGITIDQRLSFGDAASAVDSNALSAGEKQMLSFICYNAFYHNSIFLIDEPELSLHVDWQRQLFPILQSQQSSNQFVIATHSPFIYTKYPDSEISLDPDRGDTELL